MKKALTLALAAMTLTTTTHSFADVCPSLNLPRSFTTEESMFSNGFDFNLRTRDNDPIGRTELVCDENSRCYVKLFNNENLVVAMFETNRRGNISRSAVYDCNQSRIGTVQITDVNHVATTTALRNPSGDSLTSSSYLPLLNGAGTTFTTARGAQFRVYEPESDDRHFISVSTNLYSQIDARVVAVTPIIMALEVTYQQNLAQEADDSSSYTAPSSHGTGPTYIPSYSPPSSSSSSSSSSRSSSYGSSSRSRSRSSGSSYGGSSYGSSPSRSSGGYGDHHSSSYGDHSSSYGSSPSRSSGGYGDHSSSSWHSSGSSSPSRSSGGFGDHSSSSWHSSGSSSHGSSFHSSGSSSHGSSFHSSGSSSHGSSFHSSSHTSHGGFGE